MGHFSMAMINHQRVSPSLAVLEWSNVSLGNLSAGGNVTSLGSLAIWCDGVMATMWGPRSIAKLVYNSNNYGLWYANNYS